MKISAKRMFRSFFPHALIESRRQNGPVTRHRVYTTRRALRWSGAGNTQAAAWADACRRHGITAMKGPTP